MRMLLAALLSVAVAQGAEAQVTKSKFKSKTFQPVVKQALTYYAGHYVGIDAEYTIDVRFGESDDLAVDVQDHSETLPLRNPKIDGAVLTGTFKTGDNKEHAFEGVFGIRDINGRRNFGLLVNQQVKVDQDVVVQRLFCKREPQKP